MHSLRTGPHASCSGVPRDAALLQECSFALENRQSILQACDLCLSPLLPLLISLGLGNALILNLLIVLEHCIKLGLNAVTITSELCNSFVESGELLRLVLDILLLRGLGD